MKYILFLVLCLTAFPVHTQVFVEEQPPYIRVYNSLSFTVHCYVDSGSEYFEFRVPPRSYSRWFMISQSYIWECR